MQGTKVHVDLGAGEDQAAKILMSRAAFSAFSADGPDPPHPINT